MHLRRVSKNLSFPQKSYHVHQSTISSMKIQTHLYQITPNTLKHIKTPTQSSRAPASAAVYHLRASAVDGRAEDTALLEGRCSQALNELLVLDTLTWISTSSQLEQMRSRTTSLKFSFELMVNTVD